MTRRIYLDLDGVMADFDGHHDKTFGWIPNFDLTDEHWRAIHDQDDFFFNMPLKDDARQLLAGLPIDPIILTACPRSNYQKVARQKKRWVAHHLGHYLTVLPVIGGHNKPMFMHKPGDILIDDYGKNCRAWKDEGGRAIKHETAEDTLRQLKEIW